MWRIFLYFCSDLEHTSKRKSKENMKGVKSFSRSLLLAALLVAASPAVQAQSSLGELIGKVTGTTTTSSQSSDGQSLGDLIGNVLGGKTKQADLVGTWQYNAPKCSFTSQNLLAQAGGAVAADKIEAKAAPYFTKAGITASNTSFVFNKDNTFEATVYGKPFKGTYTYAPKTGKIALKGVAATINGYASRNGKKLNLVFDSTPLLKLLQTVGQVKASSTLTTLSKLAQSYSGSKLGFELKQK